MKVLNTSASLNKIIDVIEEHDQCYYTRFGDNDVMMMSGTDLYGKPLGARGYGGNKTVWSEALQEELVECFRINNPSFLIGLSASWEKEPGMSKGLFAGFGYKEKLIEKATAIYDGDEYLIPILFHYLITFRPKVFDLFVKAYIRPQKKLYIGSTQQAAVEKVIGKVDYYVQTPGKNAYSRIDEWWPDVEERLKHVKVVVPSCGQASRVVAKRIYYTRHGQGKYVIDFGSLFDPVAGIDSRTCWRMVGDKIRRRYGDAS